MNFKKSIFTGAKALVLSVPILALALLMGATTHLNSDNSKSSKEMSGVEIWANNCMRCHSLRDASTQTKAEWRVITQHMRLRGNLTGEESRKVLAFLESGAADAIIEKKSRNNEEETEGGIDRVAAILELEAKLKNGTKTYQTYCAACHGASGAGDGLVAAGMNPAPASFLKKGSMNAKSDAEVVKVILDGSPGSAMVAWGESLTDQEIANLLLKLKSFSKK